MTQPEPQHRINHLNAILRAIRNVNQLICQERNQPRLLRGVCDNLIETRGYSAAAVWLTQVPDAWIPFTYSGPDAQAVLRGRRVEPCPPGWAEALTTAEVLVRDTGQTAYALPGFTPPQGLSLMLTRIEHAGAIFGVLAVWSPSDLARDPEELSLFLEVAGDIGLALNGIRQEESRLEAERQLRESERRFRTLVSNIPGAVFRCANDANYTLAYISDAIQAITGHSPEELMRVRSYTTLIHPDDREMVHRVIDEQIARQRNYAVEYRVIDTQGRARWVYEQGQPAPTADGRDSHLDGVIVDVTRLKETEQQLHESQKMEAVGQLAGGMAHEFNNLLTIILGHLELAKAQLPSDHPAHETLDVIELAARQGADVTRSLLTFSRKYHARKEPTDLSVLLRDTTALLEPMLPDAVRLSIESSGTDPVWILGNASQLQQVIINLAVNARDAMPEGGELSIVLSADEDDPAGMPASADAAPPSLRARLTVADTGLGIAAETLPRVFEPFFTTKPRGHGTGLGLAIVHGIIEDHGGQVEVHSIPGAGATFTIRLPLAAATATPPTLKPEPPQASHLHGTVLLAEDNDAIRRLVRRGLEDENLEIIEAADGADFLRMYQELSSRLALLIVDLDLPKMSGLTCLHRIRSSGGQTPALVITGSIATEFETDPIPATHLLRKPFRVGELKEAMERLLDAHDREA